MEVYSTWVRKEIARGRFLEALGAYHGHVLGPLVEALRLLYAPTKADFGLKDISRDLSPEVVARLERLYRTRSVEEIEKRLPEALDLCHRTLAEVQTR
jgi:hypothetical protein